MPLSLPSSCTCIHTAGTSPAPTSPPSPPPSFRKPLTTPHPRHKMQSLRPSLQQLFTLSLLFACVSARRRTLDSTCFMPLPVVPHTGPGCGVPQHVDVSRFGDNDFSSGKAVLTSRRTGLDLSITLRNLSRSDYVLTAWIIWHFPGDPVPPIFKVRKPHPAR